MTFDIVKKNLRSFGILLVLFIAFACVPAYAAVPTINMLAPADPTVPMYTGNPITVQITGLNAGDDFSYEVLSNDVVTTQNFIKLSNLNMPYSLQAGSTVSLQTTNVLGPLLTLKNLTDGTEILKSPPYTGTMSFKKGNYDITIAGTQNAEVMGFDFKTAGKLAGGSDALGTFNVVVTNVKSGHLTIIVYGKNGDGPTTLTRTITIVPLVTPTEANRGGEGGGGGGAAAGGAAAQGPAALLAPPGISGTTATIQTSPSGVAQADYVIETDPAAGFQAAVEIDKGTAVTKAGAPVSEITVTPLDPASVPNTQQTGVFTFAGQAIECGPTGTQFTSGAATVSFTVTNDAYLAAAAKGQAPTVQTYNPTTGKWEDLGGVAVYDAKSNTWTISVEVTHFSMYALFYKAAAATPAPTTVPQQTFAPAAPQTTAAVPVATTPAAAKMAPTETQKSPAFPGLAALGILGAVGFLALRQRK